ncbi:MAG TPA: acyl-ACP thioesterase domain-containing protein [Bacteroidota bacterium]|nr:acyl-ACP thioesterase domain-containing protein [Bacteroidota bacterium]
MAEPTGFLMDWGSTIWEDEQFVRSYDVDCTGKLKLSSVFNYFQETAGNHATHLGVGYDILQKSGLFWVLSRAVIRLHRSPAWGERVWVQTWPTGLDGLLFMRDLRIRSGRNEPLIEAVTAWILLDGKTYRPQGASALPVPLPPMNTTHLIEQPLKKLKVPPILHQAYERNVLLGDLDVNNHVNNARYVEWLFDCYDAAFVRSHSVQMMQVNYLGEVTLGDRIVLSRSENADTSGVHYIDGLSSEKDAKVIQALITWD